MSKKTKKKLLGVGPRARLVPATIDSGGDALTRDNSEGLNYTLNDDRVGVWITVDNISVHVARRSGGVITETFPRGDEASDPIARIFTPNETADDARW